MLKSRALLLNYIHATGQEISDIETALRVETNRLCPYLSVSLGSTEIGNILRIRVLGFNDSVVEVPTPLGYVKSL